jgi:hypothetical protein
MKQRRKSAVRLLLCLALGAALSAGAEPLRDPKAAGNDCVACHGTQKVLGAKHKATQAMKMADCVECHERKTDDTLIGRLNGSHLHQLQGVTCDDCHGKGAERAPVEMEQCLSCHGSGDKVSALTAKLKQNPHDSKHYGTDLDCNLCHQQHRKSEDYCAECHTFKFKVP